MLEMLLLEMEKKLLNRPIPLAGSYCSNIITLLEVAVLFLCLFIHLSILPVSVGLAMGRDNINAYLGRY